MSLCSPASPLLAGLSPRAVTFGTGEFLPSTATLRRPGAVDTLERTSDGRVRANHTSDDGALEFDVDGWRYFTVSDCNGHVCLFFKSGVGHGDDAYIGGLLSSDGLRFGGSEAWVVMPAMVPREAGRRVSLAHNLAILRHDGKWLKIGGQDNNRQTGKANVGLWALSADEWAWHHQRSLGSFGTKSLARYLEESDHTDGEEEEGEEEASEGEADESEGEE